MNLYQVRVRRSGVKTNASLLQSLPKLPHAIGSDARHLCLSAPQLPVQERENVDCSRFRSNNACTALDLRAVEIGALTAVTPLPLGV